MYVKCGLIRKHTKVWYLAALIRHCGLSRQKCGSICCYLLQEKYYFTIGYHELEGKKVSLKKPMLVLQKVLREDPIDVESSPVVLSTQYPTQVQKTSELKAIGIIRHKILFKTRPKALISKSESKTKELK
ncbi:hypothetical protein KP509_15G038800 [Ceratopteris richardii]|uniref:Uncharacterized protein n=1 Tax=Ceratopteris richardii TaxID=49495 RepID=A0A8T2T499_CERRI|nr:hypothetical protein KP509_15G038800 [Ceratopteris richardii]